MVVRVLSGDGSTVRGTLIASDTTALSNEMSTSMTNRKFPVGWIDTTPTPVNALDGDRIVIEVGVRRYGVTWALDSFDVGSAYNVSDCLEDETGTAAYNPWIEFADNLVFRSFDARMTQTSAEAIYTPDSSLIDARITQANAEVVYLPDSSLVDARVTQLSAEVIYPINIPGNVKIRLL
jgi:hypothetical protein